MQFCIQVVVSNRSYSTNTQPIWKRRYPTGAWESQICSFYNFLFLFCTFNIKYNRPAPVDDECQGYKVL